MWVLHSDAVRLTRPRPLGGHKEGDSATVEQVLQADAPVVTASTEPTTATSATDAGMRGCTGLFVVVLFFLFEVHCGGGGYAICAIVLDGFSFCSCECIHPSVAAIHPKWWAHAETEPAAAEVPALPRPGPRLSYSKPPPPPPDPTKDGMCGDF